MIYLTAYDSLPNHYRCTPTYLSSVQEYMSFHPLLNTSILIISTRLPKNIHIRHDKIFVNMTYYSKAVAIGKKLLTSNCSPHSVTWFIVFASLLINISNTFTIRKGI